ncbi:ComF family protein [Sangeribacter muris]|uniref:ComF family protein n=1 Tax=Sangeribacter muris TaxID=2880703 RepID=UPI00244E3A27|nr:phosphoribosyltransferase family protein [Sangeribacter muris]
MPRTLYHRTYMNPMEQRFAGIFPFERGSGHFFYAGDSDLSALMHDLKYRHYKGLAEEMGKIVAQELITTPFLSDIDMILPIPMHFLKKARRGYNQTEEIAKGIHSITGIPVKTNLRATRPHRTQTKLTFDERRNNTKGIFKVTEECELKGKHILLLDDVCTTGSTLTSAATEILQAAPTSRISLLTIGVTF